MKIITLPAVPEITAITLAELHQGVAMAKNTASRAARTEKLGAAVADFDALWSASDWFWSAEARSTPELA